MREIKFRAWVKDMKRIENVFEINLEDKLVRLGVTNYDWDEFTNVELMQNTGLKDINGVEIYENDIVRVYQTCKADLVIFATGTFGIAPDDWHRFESFNDLYGNCEIIGNKFENPELLEG